MLPPLASCLITEPVAHTEGVDYTENEEEFTFNTGDATPCLEIDIEEDTALESCETFGVVLMTSDPNVILSPQSAGVIIYDNEGLQNPYNMIHRDTCTVCLHCNSLIQMRCPIIVSGFGEYITMTQLM